MHKGGKDSGILPFQLIHIEFLEMIPEGRLTGHVLQKPGDRVDGSMHRGHADQRPKQARLGERALDRDGQVLIQCRDGMSTTFFRFEVTTLSAGRLLPLGKRREEALQPI